MIALRRHLHRYPEPSGEEHRTSLRLYQILAEHGYAVRLGPDGCGVLADLTSDADQRDGVIALRADIDALRIQDQKQVEYCSVVPGTMHACGHDAHSAIVLGALLAVAHLQRQGTLDFPPRLRGIFQPAEETCAGAKQLVAYGALEHVRVAIATHVDPSRPVGRIGLRKGVLTANCDEIILNVLGEGGHAARPHESRDPISAAAQLLNWLYLQIPRSTDSMESVVFTIGRIFGGHNANVIPERVELRGTLRTLDQRVRAKTIELIGRLAESVAAGSQTQIRFETGIEAGAVVNDGKVIDMIERACLGALGPDSIDYIEKPSMGSEDFAFICERVPAAMFRLGCVSEQVGGPGLHSPLFDLDEQAIKIGARVMAETALLWCEQHSWALQKQHN
jgi:amidohydrolase